MARLQPERDPSITPLFQTMFVLQNAPMPPLARRDLTIAPVEIDSATAKFDLTLFVEEEEGELLASWEYRSELFDRESIERMHQHLVSILGAAVADPSVAIGRMALGSEAERRSAIRAASGAVEAADDAAHSRRCSRARSRTLPMRSRRCARARRSPMASSTGAPIGWRTDWSRAGVAPESLVGVCSSARSRRWSLCSPSLKAGGAYVPLDPRLSARSAGTHRRCGRPRCGGRRRAARDAAVDGLDVALLPVDADGSGRRARRDGRPVVDIRPQQPRLRALHLGLDRAAQGRDGPSRAAWPTTCAGPPPPIAASSGSGSVVHVSAHLRSRRSPSLLAPLLVGQRVIIVPEGEGVESLAALLAGAARPSRWSS